MKTSWNLSNKDFLDWASPLRPCEKDINNYSYHVSNALIHYEYSTQFILGVTPELYNLGSSYKLDVYAIDKSKSMLENIWPGTRKNALHADWLDLKSFVKRPSIITNDGGFHLMTFEEQKIFVESLSAMNLDTSCYIIRMFLPNEYELSSDQIFELLFNGLITNANVLKFLLWSAVDLNFNGKVRVSDIWDSVFRICKGDVFEVLKAVGFTEGTIRSLTFYRENSSVYSFSKLKEIEALFLESAQLTLTELTYPNYSFGEFFPIVTFMKESPN